MFPFIIINYFVDYVLLFASYTNRGYKVVLSKKYSINIIFFVIFPHLLRLVMCVCVCLWVYSLVRLIIYLLLRLGCVCVIEFGLYTTYILSTLFSPATAILVFHLVIGFRWASLYKYLFCLHNFAFRISSQLHHLIIYLFSCVASTFYIVCILTFRHSCCNFLHTITQKLRKAF